MLVLATAAAAPAAITAPALELIRVQAARTGAGVLVRLDGTFPEGDLVQQSLEIQILLRETRTGDYFVRIDLPTGGYEGESDALRDGLDAGDVAAVIAASVPSAAARLLVLAPGRIEVLLPSSFPAGAAEAQLFLIYRGEPLLSNPVGFEIGAQP
jgi:hypothetical protein